MSRKPGRDTPAAAGRRWLGGWRGPALLVVIVLGVGAIAAARWVATQPRWRVFGVSESTLPGPEVATFQVGDTAEALRTARAAIIRSPDDAAAWMGYGGALEANGYPEFAVTVYREAARLAPSDMLPRYYLAIVLDGLGKSEESLELLTELSEDPTVPAVSLGPVSIRLGDALMKAGRPAEAEQAYAMAVALAPGNGTAALGLGEALTANGKTAEAIAHLKRAVTLLGRDRAPHAALAEAYRLSGQPDEAAAEAQIAESLPVRRTVQDALRLPVTRLRPEYRRSREEGVTALRLGHYDEAIATLGRAAAAWPEDAGILSMLSLAYEQAGQADQARYYRALAADVAQQAGTPTPPPTALPTRGAAP